MSRASLQASTCLVAAALDFCPVVHPANKAKATAPAVKPLSQIRLATLMVSPLLLLPPFTCDYHRPDNTCGTHHDPSTSLWIHGMRLCSGLWKLHCRRSGHHLSCHSTSLRSSMSRISASFGSSTPVCRP